MIHPYLMRYPWPYKQSISVSSLITTETTTTTEKTSTLVDIMEPTTQMKNQSSLSDMDEDDIEEKTEVSKESKMEISNEILEAKKILKLIEEMIQYLKIKKQ